VAQPALLYLVPLCLAAPLLLAWFRGELRALWCYREQDSDPKNGMDAASVQVSD
jgi:minor histocompatibility antigen H13